MWAGPLSTLTWRRVTGIDAGDKAFLAAVHRQGAEFVAADCLTIVVVAAAS